MEQFLRLPTVLLALVLGTGIAAMIGTSHSHQPPLYTVAEVQTHLARNPGAWAGRTLLVRGLVTPAGCEAWPAPESTSCRDRRQGIRDAEGFTPLPLTLGAPNPLLGLLRRLPAVSRLVPPPPTPHMGVLATYRIQLRAVAEGLCGGTAYCYEAVLLDAVP
jgi:hypothetical protein